MLRYATRRRKPFLFIINKLFIMRYTMIILCLFFTNLLCAQKNSLISHGKESCEQPVFWITYGQSRLPLFELKRQDTVAIESFNVKYKVKEFTAIFLFRESETFKTVYNKSEKINTITKSLINKMKPEDSIIFQSIVAIKPNGEEVNISSRTFTVR